MVRWTWKKIAFGSAVSVLGAAVLLANSPLVVPKLPPFDYARLSRAGLMRLDGTRRMVTGGELWRERGAVVVAVRRPG